MSKKEIEDFERQIKRQEHAEQIILPKGDLPKMNNIIKLPNGRIFNLLEDDLTTQDYRELSGVEVRELRRLQWVTHFRDFLEKQEKGLIPPLYSIG